MASIALSGIFQRPDGSWIAPGSRPFLDHFRTVIPVGLPGIRRPASVGVNHTWEEQLLLLVSLMAPMKT